MFSLEHQYTNVDFLGLVGHSAVAEQQLSSRHRHQNEVSQGIKDPNKSRPGLQNGPVKIQDLRISVRSYSIWVPNP